jgi:hypothetical protein
MSNPSFNKRQKEKNRQDKQRDKQLERQRRKGDKETGAVQGEPGEDPDIAGIIPGPQPIPEDY